MTILLDTGILGKLCHPRCDPQLAVWFVSLLKDQGSRVVVILPEIADYELRRELLRGIAAKKISPVSLQRLNDLAENVEYFALSTRIMRDAAQLWADSRNRGKPTADPKALDGDVLLAAQARAVNASAVIITENRKHLNQLGVDARDWRDIA